MRNFSRRQFCNTFAMGAAAGALLPRITRQVNAAEPTTRSSFPVPGASSSGPAWSFILLGDLHYDKMEHHDLEWLQRDKPDDVRQVQDYSRITAELMPKLFASVKATIADLNRDPRTNVAFVLQVGDLVEGLCGSEALATRQNTEAVEFVNHAQFGVPFLFAKGNHDVTGPGAVDAFKSVFCPFLAGERKKLAQRGELAGACYEVEHGDSLLCFYDAYNNKESLAWLEASLARRTARHCFVVVHPPVVPYGARSLWYVFSQDREQAQREKLLDLLGKNHAIVLGGHIHKYSLLARTTPAGGRFAQLAVSSVIGRLETNPQHLLDGVESYNADQLKVEPSFSPTTEKQRRAIYATEALLVKEFQYADLPGYAVVSVQGGNVLVHVYSGVTRRLWRTVDLSGCLQA